jgi:DNA-binding NarL/FixJ family response regulator
VPVGETFEEIALGQIEHVVTPLEGDAVESLTRREREILRLVAEGMTNEEIGKKIFISEKTVKTHLTNIFDKLKVNNRFKAALMIMGHRQE